MIPLYCEMQLNQMWSQKAHADWSPAKPNTSRQVIISVIWFWSSLPSIIKRQLPYTMYLQFVMNICSEAKFSFVFFNFLRWRSIQTYILIDYRCLSLKVCNKMSLSLWWCSDSFLFTILPSHAYTLPTLIPQHLLPSTNYTLIFQILLLLVFLHQNANPWGQNTVFFVRVSFIRV